MTRTSKQLLKFVAKLMQSKPNLYIICWALLESQQIQKKHHMTWYYCTILYTYLTYISILYTWLISFQSSHSLMRTFLGPEFLSKPSRYVILKIFLFGLWLGLTILSCLYLGCRSDGFSHGRFFCWNWWGGKSRKMGPAIGGKRDIYGTDAILFCCVYVFYKQ